MAHESAWHGLSGFGRAGKAIELFEELWRIEKSRRGPDGGSILSVINNLAIAYERPPAG